MASEGVKMADGGTLIDLLRSAGRSSRFDLLQENRLKRMKSDNQMFAQLGSDASPLSLFGPLPDHKLKEMAHMAPRSRQRFLMYNTRVPDESGHATELGSLAANWGGKGGDWIPEDFIDLDIKKPFQKQGYGKETLALMLSNLKNENERFRLWDVKRSAKPYWESLGATIDDPTKPFRTKEKRVFDRDGMFDMERSIPRNNNYWITPGDFLDSLKADGGIAGYAGGGDVSKKLMHVTLRKYIDAIREKGLTPGARPPNWMRGDITKGHGKGEFYEEPYNFAFDHPDDALRWANRMDWDLNQKMGSGRISVLGLDRMPQHRWIGDENDPLSQMGSAGQWWKSPHVIEPQYIGIDEPVTSSVLKSRKLQRFAQGGSIQDQNEQMGPRAAAIARINEQVMRSRQPMMQGSDVSLPHRSMPMLSAFAKDYRNVLDPRLTPIGRYPRGFAMGGRVHLGDIDHGSMARDFGRGFNGDYFSTAIGLDPDWQIQAHYDQDVGFYADGGKAEKEQGGGFSGGDLLPLLAFARARHINALARPFARALSKPVLGIEAVSKGPLSARQSRARFDLAREDAGHEFAKLPVSEGQGAWMGDKGMEFNPLYMQELPRTMGRMRNYDDALRYASQMGENLEQAATPVSRFVPHLLNTSEGADALQVTGMDDKKLRRLAELLGPEVVTAHRPKNKALVFSIGDKRTPKELADEINAAFSFPGIRYGRSEPGVDRVLATRAKEPWADLSYEEAGAKPRGEAYEAIERRLLERLRDRPGLYHTARGAK